MKEKKAVPKTSDGKRRDAFLSESFGITRSQAKKWICGGYVFLNGFQISKAGDIVRENDEITANIPEKKTLSATPFEIEIVFENGDFLVVKKPAGILTHPDETHGENTLVQRVLCHCSLSDIGLPKRPGVIHRLDKDTSGLLVFAKNDKAHRYFTDLFSSRNIEKKYIALVHGKNITDSGTIDSPITRSATNRKKMNVSASEKAKNAVSHFDVLKRFEDVALLSVKIETGRTHQIRVHLSAIDHPIVGDGMYGNKKLDALLEKKYGKVPRLFLHAESLRFVPPNMDEKMDFFAELPKDLKDFLEKMEKKKKV